VASALWSVSDGTALLFNGPDRCLRPIVDSDLAQERLGVDLDGRFRDANLAGDILVRVSVGDTPQNALFSARKLRNVAAGLSPPLTRSARAVSHTPEMETAPAFLLCRIFGRQTGFHFS
jgi:hypothetical protein